MKQSNFLLLISISLIGIAFQSCENKQEIPTVINKCDVFDFGVSNHSTIPGYENSIVGASTRLLEIKDGKAIISFFVTYSSQKTGTKQVRRIKENNLLAIENNPAVLELLHNEVKDVLPKLQSRAVNIVVLDDTDEVIVLVNSPEVKGGAKLKSDM